MSYNYFIALLFIGILLIKSVLVFFWIPDYYNTNEDYITLSFGHAINLDIWLRNSEIRHLSTLNTMHPGFLFQLTSWILYVPDNLTTHPYLAAIENILNPNLFWIKNQYVAFFLNLIFIFYSSKLFDIKSKLDFSIFLSLFYIFHTTFNFNFLILGNESFSIPLFILIFYNFSLFDKTRKIRYLFILAVLYSLSYLNKVNYIGYIPAIFIVFFIKFVSKSSIISLKEFTFNSLVIILSFIIFTFISSYIILGLEGTKGMFDVHFSIIANSGPYGSGERGIYNFSKMLYSLKNLLYNEWKICVIIFPIIIYNIILIFKNYLSSKNILYKNIFVIFSFLGILFVVLKQYSNHYFVPAVITIPFLYLEINKILAKKIKITILITSLILISYNFFEIISFKRNFFYQSNINSINELKKYNDELYIIRNIINNSNGITSWNYRIKSVEYGRRFVLTWSDNMFLHKILDIDYFRDQIDLDIETKKPEILVYQKSYISLFNPDLYKYYKIIFDGEHLIVLKNINKDSK